MRAGHRWPPSTSTIFLDAISGISLGVQVNLLRVVEDKEVCEIFLLAHHFASMSARRENREPPRFSENALTVLRNYHWPGNVRESESVVHRLVTMTNGGVIGVSDVPSLLRFSGPRKPAFERSLAEFEADYIFNVLDSVGGNKTRAAKILGIDRKTLREKLQRIQGS